MCRPLPLLAGLLLSLVATAQAACPAPRAPVLERFIAADCTTCWADSTAAGSGWVFDWIVPVAAGDDAALSAAATPEARARQQRARPGPAARSELRVQALSGPAWNGYLGLEVQVRGRTPAGATAWLALVEQLPAGSEGSAVPRWLLRNVAGPLPLAGARLLERRAMRWPEGAKPERLVARAWVEDAQGRIIAVGQERCGARLPIPNTLNLR